MLMPAPWTLWVSHSTNISERDQYTSNLGQLLTMKTWDELAYFWQESHLADPMNYFAQIKNGQYRKYKWEDEDRKIDSINIFKEGAEPTWQYGDHWKGGVFSFNLPDDFQVKEFFRATVWMAVGGTLTVAKHFIGVRIVDTAVKKRANSQCRLEIWVDFSCSEQRPNYELQRQCQTEFKRYFEPLDVKLPGNIRFANISSDNIYAERLQANKN